MSKVFLGCLCGHMHGAGGCFAEVVVEEPAFVRPCGCRRFRRGPEVTVWDSRLGRLVRRPDVSGGNTVTVAPGYHLEAYGLQNPMVQEAIRLGAYWDIVPPAAEPRDAFDKESRAIALRMKLL